MTRIIINGFPPTNTNTINGMSVFLVKDQTRIYVDHSTTVDI